MGLRWDGTFDSDRFHRRMPAMEVPDALSLPFSPFSARHDEPTLSEGLPDQDGHPDPAWPPLKGIKADLNPLN